MKHQLYLNHTKSIPNRGNDKTKFKGDKDLFFQSKKNPDDLINIRYKNLLKKYAAAPKKMKDIQNHYYSYILNLSIAKDLKSKEQENKVTKEINHYFKLLEKGKV